LEVIKRFQELGLVVENVITLVDAPDGSDDSDDSDYYLEGFEVHAVLRITDIISAIERSIKVSLKQLGLIFGEL